MFRKIKVGARLSLGFASVTLLLVLLALISVLRIGSMNESLHLLVEDRYPKVRLVYQAVDNVNVSARALRNAILRTEPVEIGKEEDRVKAAGAAIGGILAELDQAIASAEGKRLLASVVSTRAAYLKVQALISQSVRAGDRDAAVSLLFGDFRARQAEYLDAWTALEAYQLSLADSAATEAESLTAASRAIIIGISALAVLAAVLLAFAITGSILKPLSACTDAAERIARGDLSVSFEEGGKDELAALQISIKTLAGTVSSLIAETDELSSAAVAGRLTERGDPERFSGAYRELVSGINALIDGVVGFLDNMPTPAMIIDAEYRILYMNKAGASLGAGNAAELASARRQCYDFFKTKDCRSERCACGRAMKIGSSASSETVAVPLKEQYEIAYTGVPVLDRSGATVGAFEVIVDQTAIKKAERKMVKVADFQNGEIGKLNEYLTTVAAGDLSGNFVVAEADGDTAETKERLDSLAAALNTSLDSINDILSQVSASVDQVNAGSQQVSQASQSLSQGATEQASSLEEITSSVTEISGQTRQNTENAVQVNTLAKTARNDAEQGNTQMADLVSAMSDINESAEEIRKIVKAIDDISFQINLLALNANVEAARAGKYGKGFAVVAEEVRNLAVRSAGSVKETTKMVDEAIANIGRGNELVDVTAKQLASIVDGAAKVAGLAEEVSKASREQSQGLEQISTGLNQIDQVTQANTASAEESASAAEELSSQAQQLKGMVARFKLKERERSRMSEAEMLAMLRAEMSRGGGSAGTIPLLG